jgi:hypothetical protein
MPIKDGTKLNFSISSKEYQNENEIIARAKPTAGNPPIYF